MNKTSKTMNTKKQGIKLKNDNLKLRLKIKQADKKIKMLNDFIKKYIKLCK